MLHTLTNTEVSLLREFQAADKAFYAAQAELNASTLGDRDSNCIIARYKAAYQERQNKATVFAACVSAETGSV